MSLITYSWTLKATNTVVVSGATLPKCVSESLVGDTITGIPYCWGGFDSKNEFATKVGKGYMAGNVSKKELPDSTTGLDGSGFISYVYGLGSHYHSSDLYDQCKTKLTDFKSLNSMDLLYKVGHVMLCYEKDNTYITVYEATSEGEQKTRIHTYTTYHLFTTLGYKCATPW